MLDRSIYPLNFIYIHMQQILRANVHKTNFFAKARKLNYARLLHITSPRHECKQALVCVLETAFPFREKRHFRFNLQTYILENSHSSLVETHTEQHFGVLSNPFQVPLDKFVTLTSVDDYRKRQVL